MTATRARAVERSSGRVSVDNLGHRQTDRRTMGEETKGVHSCHSGGPSPPRADLGRILLVGEFVESRSLRDDPRGKAAARPLRRTRPRRHPHRVGKARRYQWRSNDDHLARFLFCAALFRARTMRHVSRWRPEREEARGSFSSLAAWGGRSRTGRACARAVAFLDEGLRGRGVRFEYLQTRVFNSPDVPVFRTPASPD